MSVQHAMLCGDEIKGAVVDLGTSISRFGTAGQDVPRHVFKSRIGEIPGSGIKPIIGEPGLRYIHEEMTIHGPSSWQDSKSQNLSHLLQYGIADCMRLQCADTPVFLAENALLSGDTAAGNNKEKVLETCFESVRSPAVYLGNSAMMSAFSMGRITSLVIDIGTAGTTITPIVDGYQLKKSTIYTSRGGNLLDSMLHDEIYRRTGGPIHLWCDRNRHSSKLHVASVTPSFRQYHESEVVQDVKQWMCFVPHDPILIGPEVTNPAAISHLRDEELQRRLLSLPPPYELPDGTLVYAGESVCTLPEKLFFPSIQPTAAMGNSQDPSSSSSCQGMPGHASSTRKRTRELVESTLSETSAATTSTTSYSQYPADSIMSKLGTRAEMESLSDLVYACVAHADPDVRRELLGNIQIVGGGSLLQGLSNRLINELNTVVPSHMKVKLVNGLPVERHHAAWIGGSILGICGSFQQLWLTRQEYDEMGSARAALRFDH